MDMHKIEPKDYTPTEPTALDPDAEYTKHGLILRATIKALVKDRPVEKGDIIRHLMAVAAPGNSPLWARAIEDVDREWHPEKYEPVVVDDPLPDDPKVVEK